MACFHAIRDVSKIKTNVSSTRACDRDWDCLRCCSTFSMRLSLVLAVVRPPHLLSDLLRRTASATTTGPTSCPELWWVFCGKGKDRLTASLLVTSLASGPIGMRLLLASFVPDAGACGPLVALW